MATTILSRFNKTITLKQIFFTIIFLVLLSPMLMAQRIPVATKKVIDTTRVQTLNLPATSTYQRKPATTPATVPDANAPLADIKLVSFEMKLLNTQDANGVIGYFYEVTYLLKNEGNISVSADSIGMQGAITYQTPVASSTPACGALISQVPGLTLAPGATHKGSFRCTSPLDRNNNPVYVLTADAPNLVRELNEQNNKLQIGITF